MAISHLIHSFFSLPLYPETCRVSNSFMPSTTSLRAMRVISCQNMFLDDTFNGAVNVVRLLTDSDDRLKNDECQWMYTHVTTERSSLHVLSRDSCLLLYLTWRSDSWLCHLAHFVRILPSVLFRTQTWPVNGMFSPDLVEVNNTTRNYISVSNKLSDPDKSTALTILLLLEFHLPVRARSESNDCRI